MEAGGFRLASNRLRLLMTKCILPTLTRAPTPSSKCLHHHHHLRMFFRSLTLGRTIFRNKNISPYTLHNFSGSARSRAMPSEYKLKGLSALDLKTGEKREVEVEGIEKGKVLLVKSGDKIQALSSNCTHYGAPLKNGVLTPDGRLTCPWHGGSSITYSFTCLSLCFIHSMLQSGNG